MRTEFFIVRKIAFANRKSFSAFIIRIAVIAVALSISTMIIATSMVNGFQKEIRYKVMSFWSHLEIVPYSFTSTLREAAVPINQPFYKSPATLPGVEHIQVIALKGGLLKTDDAFEGVMLKGIGSDFDWHNMQPYIRSGTSFIAGSAGAKRNLLISTATASRLNITVGDKVLVTFMDNNIRNRPFIVKGIYETGLEEFDKKYAICDIGVIQDLNHWGSDSVGGFELFLRKQSLFKNRLTSYYVTLFGGLMSEERRQELNRDPLDMKAAEIAETITDPRLDVLSIKDFVPGIFDWLDLQTMNEMIILFLMVIVAVINMVTALLILILERTNMIGLLKALGSNNTSITKIFILYSAVIIGAGLLIGNTFGIGICLLQDKFHLITLPKESYYLNYAPVEINYAWIAGLNLLTIFVCLLILLIPSRLIAKITPVNAIKFQ